MPEETITNPPTESSPSAKAMGDETPSPTTSAPVTPTETPTATPPVVVPEPVTPPPVPVVTTAPAPDPVRSLLAKALAKIQFRKQAKLEKIMVLVKSKGQVTNDDAQKLLRVSDATATRYLAQLAKAGRLQRTGVRGGAVYRFVQ